MNRSPVFASRARPVGEMNSPTTRTGSGIGRTVKTYAPRLRHWSSQQICGELERVIAVIKRQHIYCGRKTRDQRCEFTTDQVERLEEGLLVQHDPPFPRPLDQDILFPRLPDSRDPSVDVQDGGRPADKGNVADL